MRDPLNISINWKEKMQFTASNEKTNYEVAIDSPYLEEGGEKKGTTPKHLFLQGIAGCTGQVVVAFLRKMRADMPEKFKIDIKGVLTTEHPMYFEVIDIIYHFEGKTSVDIIKKVIKMSEEKYCGLTYMVSKLAKINITVLLNGKNIEI